MGGGGRILLCYILLGCYESASFKAKTSSDCWCKGKVMLDIYTIMMLSLFYSSCSSPQSVFHPLHSSYFTYLPNLRSYTTSLPSIFQRFQHINTITSILVSSRPLTFPSLYVPINQYTDRANRVQRAAGACPMKSKIPSILLSILALAFSIQALPLFCIPLSEYSWGQAPKPLSLASLDNHSTA